jgi:hypothetical protein
MHFCAQDGRIGQKIVELAPADTYFELALLYLPTSEIVRFFISTIS